MTPKEKAEDLFVTFYQRYPDVIYTDEGAKMEAKYCALVVIDEVISALKGYDFYFWHEVKTELDKL